MSDIKFIRENSELVKEAARKKSVSVDIDHLLELDKRIVQHMILNRFLLL